MSGEPGYRAPEDGAPGAGEPGATARDLRADRRVLILFSVYVAVLLLGAFAQVTDNRTILDWFDLHRWLTR